MNRFTVLRAGYGILLPAHKVTTPRQRPPASRWFFSPA
jgi:hypothetical protein